MSDKTAAWLVLAVFMVVIVIGAWLWGDVVVVK